MHNDKDVLVEMYWGDNRDNIERVQQATRFELEVEDRDIKPEPDDDQ